MVTTNDYMQAIVAAILFGEDAAIAASGDEYRRDSEFGTTLFLGAGRDASVSTEAARILKEAYKRAQEVTGETHAGSSVTTYRLADRLTVAEYDELHRIDEAEAKLEGVVSSQEAAFDTLEKRILDLEAEHFADRLEREVELGRWKDGIAASVGEAIEDVENKIFDAIEASRRGDDVTGLLFEAHGDLCNIAADLLTMDPGAEGEA